MKKWLSYIISAAIACLCYSCSGDEVVTGTDHNGSGNSEGIVIRLGITSRADGGGSISGADNKTITNLKVWMVNEDDESFSFYKEVSDANGINFDENDIYSFEMEISLLKPGKYGFYILANSDNISGVTFDKDTKPAELQAAYFTGISGGDEAQVAIPMYGEYHSVEIVGTRHDYYVQVPIERVLAKLELFFAKKNSASSLVINSVAITNVPDKGFISPQKPLNTGGWDNSLKLSLNDSEDGIITGVASNFTNYDSYTSLSLSSPFLFENPEGCLNNDVSQSGNNHGYQVTISYVLNEKLSTQIIYLTEVARNTIYKIYGLVGDKDANTQFILVPQEWTLNEEEIDFTDVVTYSVTGWDKNTCDLNEGEHELVLKNDENNAVAYIEFQVQAPTGAQWLVTLTNTIDFELVGEISGNVGGNIIRVGVKAKDFHSEVYHETQLRVYTIAGGRSIELDMTKENVAEQKPEKEVNHYTIIQSF